MGSSIEESILALCRQHPEVDFCELIQDVISL